MKTKKAGLITKVVILVLLVCLTTSLLGKQGEIRAAKKDVETLSTQVTEKKQSVAELSDTVEHSDDPEVIRSVARSKGFVTPGEKIFIDLAE